MRAEITPTQQLVLERMAAGDRMAEGAEALGMAAATYRTHVQAILTRLHLHTAAGAVAYGYRQGILEIPGRVLVPRELVEDALAFVLGDVEQLERPGVQARLVAGLAYALSIGSFTDTDAEAWRTDREAHRSLFGDLDIPPAEIGQPSGLECNGCGLELIVGEPHECPVLGTVVRVDPAGDDPGRIRLGDWRGNPPR